MRHTRLGKVVIGLNGKEIQMSAQKQRLTMEQKTVALISYLTTRTKMEKDPRMVAEIENQISRLKDGTYFGGDDDI